jgi:excisionase family DNA binding protein
VSLDELDGRIFADVPEVARLTGRDERTVRKACRDGEIPATKLGTKYMIPVEWLRQQATVAAAESVTAATPDIDALADRLADRLFARFACLLGAAR